MSRDLQFRKSEPGLTRLRPSASQSQVGVTPFGSPVVSPVLSHPIRSMKPMGAHLSRGPVFESVFGPVLLGQSRNDTFGGAVVDGVIVAGVCLAIVVVLALPVALFDLLVTVVNHV